MIPRLSRPEFGQGAPPPGGYSVAHFEEALESMARRLALMRQTRDVRAIFQLTYLTFSRSVLQALKAGRFEDGAWATDMCCRFVEVYIAQLELFDRRDPGMCRPWRAAFEAMEEGRVSVMQAMLLGMNAHIHYDLAFVTLGACRAAGDLTGEKNASDRSLTGARAGVPVARYRDFLVINQVGWESLPLIQDTVLRAFSPWLYWVNRLTRRVTRFLGERVLIEARDTSWRQTCLLLHAADDDEREMVSRVIDAFAASVADLIGIFSLRPDVAMESATSWMRRWERLDPQAQSGLVEMARRNGVVAELALRELAFAGAEPVSVLETLVESGNARLAGEFGLRALRSSPWRRIQRLRRYLRGDSARVGAVQEAMLDASDAPRRLARELGLGAIQKRWREALNADRRFLQVAAVAAHPVLHDAIARTLAAREAQFIRLGCSVPAAPDRVEPLLPGDAEQLLLNHPDAWVRVCARDAFKRNTEGEHVEPLIDRVLFLKGTSIFMEVEPSVLVAVAEKLEARAFRADQTLVRSGEHSEGLCLIRSGQVEVTQTRDGQRVRIATLRAGDAVGELSALNDTHATADCTAVDATACYLVPTQVLSVLLQQQPRLGIGLIRVLSQRLMSTTMRVPGTKAPQQVSPT